jgi:hypothetical protein
MNDAQEAFVVAMQDKNTSNIDAAVKNLEAAPHLDQKADELRDRLKLLLTKAKETPAAAEAPPQREANKSTKESSLTQEFVSWRKEYNQWLKTSGRNHSGLSELK